MGDDTTAKIIGIEEDGFIYSFENRMEIRYRLLFSDLLKIELHPIQISRSIDIRDLEDGYLKMKGKYPYYYRVYNLISQISLDHYKKTNDKIALKKFIIIIDEINRANLSTVLGELIYALEYRNEAVDSIYETDLEGTKLVLPPNLYIIGTMNTADRSVGHIDYAIRRRFAFVDVLPKKLESNDHMIFHADLFKKVAELFITNYDDYLENNEEALKSSTYLSAEFDPKDVWLGHSYFIQKKLKNENNEDVLEPLDFNIRVKYEIVPILKEYVKDGVLHANAAIKIDEIEKDYQVS